MGLILRLIKESFIFAWQALIINKVRTLLSLLGVTIGIFSIIFVLSMVDSLEANMKQSFDMIGNDILFIQKWPMAPEKGDEEYAWWKYMRRRQPSLKDMELLESRMISADAIAYQASSSKTAEYKNNFMSTSYAMGVTYEYDQVIALKLSVGRYFTPVECDGGSNYAVIGHSVKEQLFGEISPLGREMKIGGLKVVVIGVFEKEGQSIFGNGFDQVVMMPMGFASRLISIRDEDTSIILKAKNGISNKQLRDEVMANFRAVRGVKPGADSDFSIIESIMISGMVDSLISSMSMAGGMIGIFAILIGAFSIANIMFVSVRERTNIIGIQKALGAKNYMILAQFLFEAVALCIIGALIGLILVWISMLILTSAVDFDFMLPLSRIVFGIGISVIVGLVSGIFPAWLAFRLNPVDAIRSK